MPALLDSIKAKHGKDVLMTISTHFHEDRTGGINYYKNKGIRTYSTSYTQRLCKESNKPIAGYTFTNDTTFNIGGYAIEIFYPGKGHAPDNIVAYLPAYKVLYGGCFVKEVGSTSLGNLSDADPNAWKTSMEKTIRRYPSPAYVIPGHGSWQSNKGLQATMMLLKNYKK